MYKEDTEDCPKDHKLIPMGNLKHNDMGIFWCCTCGALYEVPTNGSKYINDFSFDKKTVKRIKNNG